jgi:hypothetical protein
MVSASLSEGGFILCLAQQRVRPLLMRIYVYISLIRLFIGSSN